MEGASAAIQAGKRVLIKLHGDHEDENWVLTLARSTSPAPSPFTAARISVR
ncbi:MAG: hypothetical protein K2Q23_14400 [Bryobacteraceae bacterium]|nr:hypothetical protein [Bryobacteraceae bacterium]